MVALIEKKLGEIRLEVRDAALSSKRDPESVRLLAVSKTFPSEKILEAYNSGQREFGENKLQELEVKVPALPKDIKWHFIGHLQGNKVGKVVELADFIHSVDSVKLLKRIDRIAGEKKRHPNIFLEVNISGEESKFGLKREDVAEVLKTSFECGNINLIGFMTMAPFGVSEGKLMEIFYGMKELRDKLQKELSIKLPELSMGMSSDYKSAIACGSTIVRIGSAIFGSRDLL